MSEDERRKSVLAAARVVAGARDGRRLLDALVAVPEDERNDHYYRQAITGMEIVLRVLVDGVATIVEDTDRPTQHELTDEQLAFAVEGGVSEESCGDEAIQEAADWMLWSALRRTSERMRLDSLSARSALLIVPGLREVAAAFPDDYDDLDQFAMLRTPREELSGLSPILWLLYRGNPAVVVQIVKDLSWT